MSLFLHRICTRVLERESGRRAVQTLDALDQEITVYATFLHCIEDRKHRRSGMNVPCGGYSEQIVSMHEDGGNEDGTLT